MKRRTGMRVLAGILAMLMLAGMIAGCAGSEDQVADEMSRSVSGSEPMAATDSGAAEGYAGASEDARALIRAAVGG